MTACFITLLNMSVTASVTALAVMLLRAIFKKLPKWLTCALWALVGLRLLLPFSWESALSLMPRASTLRETVGQFAGTAGTTPAPVTGGTEYFIVSNFIPPQPRSVPAAQPFDWLGLLTWVWIGGMAAMLGYMVVSALLLQRRVGASAETEPGVFTADGLPSPFVLGMFRPKIYLPAGLNAVQKEMILAHERAHLQRRDHLVKPLAFLLLAIYWFNPVLWAAYALLCRDIELACDEKVIRDMDRADRAFYSQTLLDCGRQRKLIAACPLAFGEVGVKERVKNVLNYKKPAFWIIIIAVVAGIALAVCFLTDPKTEPPTDAAENETIDSVVSDAALDSRIFAALKEQSSGKYLEGECYTEAHYIFDTEEKDGKTVVYALVREAWFGFVNYYFTEVSGSQCPMVLTFDGDDCAIERAQDGERYAESLKELFPEKYANAILRHGDGYSEKLWNKVAEQARAYLHRIDRSATVCPTSEAGLSTLSDHGVSAEVSNKLIAMFDEYPYYGTVERIEDGVRYQYGTGCDMEQNRITYEKSVYGEDGHLNPVEQTVVDAATGEIISAKSFPVELPIMEAATGESGFSYSGPVEQGKDVQLDVDWIEAAKIDEAVFDVDGDGTLDRCILSYGPTSGLFTFYLTVIPKGTDEPKYQGIFWTDHLSDLHFMEFKKEAALYVAGLNPLASNDKKRYRILIENGEPVLRADDGDMPHWPGESQVLGLNRLRRQYPKLFELNAEKGLDVYVWPWGVGDGQDWKPAYRCWLTESTAEQRKNWKEYKIIPDDKNGFNTLKPEEMKEILASYNLPPEKITVIPYQHPLSSYLWAQDGKIVDGNVTVEDLRAMLGLS